MNSSSIWRAPPAGRPRSRPARRRRGREVAHRGLRRPSTPATTGPERRGLRAWSADDDYPALPCPANCQATDPSSSPLSRPCPREPSPPGWRGRCARTAPGQAARRSAATARRRCPRTARRAGPVARSPRLAAARGRTAGGEQREVFRCPGMADRQRDPAIAGLPGGPAQRELAARRPVISDDDLLSHLRHGNPPVPGSDRCGRDCGQGPPGSVARAGHKVLPGKADRPA